MTEKTKQQSVEKTEEKIAEAKASEDKQLTDKKVVSVKDEAKVSKESKEKKKESKKPKKTEAVVNARNLPISTKDSIAVCRFIKNKKIGDAVADLEQVLLHKKAIPMKGEIPHRKGKGLASGRYLDKTVKNFIKLLKSLSANASANELDEPIIVEAVANFASRPYGKFGRVQKKRTHVKIIAKEKSIKEIKKIKRKRK